MILFLRSSDIGIDARLRRYARALRDAGIEHAALFWDRDGRALGDPAIATIRYRARGGYGNRALTGLRLIALNLFAIRQVWRLRHRVSLLHAVDLDTALAAWVLNRLTGLPFTYDIYDHYPDSRGITGKWRRLCNWFESKVIARAHRIIIADAARIAQHTPIPQNRLLVIENVPDISLESLDPGPLSGGRLRLGYLGTLEEQFRGIEHLLDTVEAMEGIELDVAGTGPLEPLVAARAARCPRIRFHGPMNHEQGLALLARCDVVAGLYYLGVPNHRFAAPNKYYEHLALGRAMLTSRGTPPGARVVEHDTGWAVDDCPQAIRAAIAEAQADRAALAAKGERARALWQARYADHFVRAIAGDYVQAMRGALPA